jgi:hypothetical protein
MNKGNLFFKDLSEEESLKRFESILMRCGSPVITAVSCYVELGLESQVRDRLN